MVLGYHITIGTYGFWLPNDPRGSGSSYVGAKHLWPFGDATGLDDRRRSVARQPHDWRRRLKAKRHLKYPAVQFTGIQAKAIGDGIGEYVRRNGLIVWACCILPDHLHMVVARHLYDVESIIEQLKGAATRRLLKEGLHPLMAFRPAGGRPPCCWGRGSRHDFLDTRLKIRQKILYVDDNPYKEGKPRQHWRFVVPYLD